MVTVDYRGVTVRGPLLQVETEKTHKDILQRLKMSW